MTENFRQSEAGKLTAAIILAYCAYALFALISYGLQIDGVRVNVEEARLGADFLNFWTGGHQAIAGNVDALYDADAHMTFLTQEFGTPLGHYAFSYPPHALPLLTPFGALPYKGALLMWSVLGMAAYVFAGRSFGFDRKYLSLMIIAPASLVCLMSGQTGFWTAALLIGGLSQLNKRPWLAGILFGLLTIKPQMGLLLALALLSGGHWRVILSAIVTFAALLIGSFLLYGAEPWHAFFNVTLPYQSNIIENSIGYFDHMVHTPFKYLINIGAPNSAAYGVQAVFAVGPAVAIIWTFRQNASSLLKASLLCSLTLLFSPYMAVYDMPILTFAILAYVHQHRTPLTLPKCAFLLLLALTPIIGTVASRFNIPLSVGLISVFAFLILCEIKAMSVADIEKGERHVSHSV